MSHLNLIDGTKHFYWHEVYKHEDHKTTDPEICENIIRLAHNLEHIRTLLGNKPLFITSWYRPKYYNKYIGGSPRSKHLEGIAVDFYCRHTTPERIYEVAKKYLKESGGLGLYPGHVHLDLRKTKARWFKSSY